MSKHVELLRDPSIQSAASFNPRTYLIDLPGVQVAGEHATAFSEDELAAALMEADSAVLRHELVHYFQMTSTAYGAIELVTQLESLTQKLEIISHAIAANSGTLNIALRDHIREKGTRNLKRKLDTFESGLIFANLRRGTISPPFEEKDSENFHGTGIFRCGWPKKFPKKSPFARNLIYVGYTSNDDEAILRHFGAKQVLEGGAYAVDMVASRLNGSEHRLHAKLYHPEGEYFDGYDIPIATVEQIFDPYLMANSIYGQIVKDEVRPSVSLEELYLISDLSLFFDPVIMNWPSLKKKNAERRNKEITELRAAFLHPGEVFLNLCHALQSDKLAVRRIAFGYSDSAPTEFQRDLAMTFAPDHPLEKLIDNTIDFLEFFFSESRPRFISDEMAEIYLGMFRRSLGYRRAVMEKSSLMIDFFTDHETFVKFCRASVPGFVLNGQMLTKNTKIPGVGVGVQLLRLEVLDELASSILSGQEKCYLRDQLCNASRVDICGNFSNAIKGSKLNHLKHCVRDEMIGFFDWDDLKVVQEHS